MSQPRIEGQDGAEKIRNIGPVRVQFIHPHGVLSKYWQVDENSWTVSANAERDDAGIFYIIQSKVLCYFASDRTLTALAVEPGIGSLLTRSTQTNYNEFMFALVAETRGTVAGFYPTLGIWDDGLIRRAENNDHLLLTPVIPEPL